MIVSLVIGAGVWAVALGSSRKVAMSSATVLIPAMPKLSTRTLATFGDKKAGSVGPKWISFTPIAQSGRLCFVEESAA